MAVMSLPQDYGYVISAGIGAIVMVMWKGVRVGMVRYGGANRELYLFLFILRRGRSTAWSTRRCTVRTVGCSTVSREPTRTPWRTCLNSCSSSPWVGQSQLPPSYTVTTFDIRWSLLSSPLCCCRLGLDCWQGCLCTRYEKN